MSTVQNQLERMRALMNYGLKNEEKQYSSVEYQKKGADGKTYGIVREGTKYYIKVSEDKGSNLMKESFDYIGGFCNRKNNEYSSYANALKQFDLKMISLKEANSADKDIIIESWNPETSEYNKIKATDSMKKELARQREIMENAKKIDESKECNGSECKDKGKKNFYPKEITDYNGKKIKSNGGDPFTETSKMGQAKNNIKKEGKEAKETLTENDTLAWNRNKDYMDKSHGTEIGDTAPFDDKEGRDIDDNDSKDYSTSEMKNGVVEEETAMHVSQDQNSPSVGVNEIGDDDPFTEKPKGIQEAEGEDDFEVGNGDEDLDVDIDNDGDDDVDIDLELDDDDEFGDGDVDDDEIFSDSEDTDGEEDMLGQIMDKLESIDDRLSAIESANDVDTEFDDDGELYDDEDFDDEDFDDEDFDDDEDGDVEVEFNSDEPVDDNVVETKGYKLALLEDRLDDFGKHPAYRKTPFQLPPTNGQMKHYDGEYDMNDDSVYNEQPYGEKIGSGAPFEVDPEKIENAIAESIIRVLGKK